MNALIEHADFIQADHHTIFSPRAQGAFLASLQLFGNVRLACRAACVSAQTAYRARRRSAGFARAWDAALLAARDHAEQVLAERAINGVEEAVYYHGEEVARRRRFDSRLLLAHLARLDRLEDDPAIAAELGRLDARIEALRRGERLVERSQGVDGAEEVALRQAEGERVCEGTRHSSQDRVPGVPSRGNGAGANQHASNSGAREAHDAPAHAPAYAPEYTAKELVALYARWPRGCHAHRLPPPYYPEWVPDMDDPEHWVRGEYAPPFGRLLCAMEDARPEGAKQPWQLARDLAVELGAAAPSGDAIEAMQIEAFAAGEEEWWLLTPGLPDRAEEEAEDEPDYGPEPEPEPDAQPGSAQESAD